MANFTLRHSARRPAQGPRGQAGFTLVELMIATMVFSTILIVITAGIISFSIHYYKGVTSSNTQATASAALDTITQLIQFSGDQINNSVPGVVCVGNQQFTYNLGKELEPSASGDQDTWSLYQTTGVSGSCTPSHSGGRELLSKNMRLASFSVCSVGGVSCAAPSPTNTWKVSMRVVYGDIDLICAPASVPSVSCNGTGSLGVSDVVNHSLPDLTCRSQTGSQFCAVAGLSTVAQKRVGTDL